MVVHLLVLAIEGSLWNPSHKRPCIGPPAMFNNVPSLLVQQPLVSTLDICSPMCYNDNVWAGYSKEVCIGLDKVRNAIQGHYA